MTCGQPPLRKANPEGRRTLRCVRLHFVGLAPGSPPRTLPRHGHTEIPVLPSGHLVSASGPALKESCPRKWAWRVSSRCLPRGGQVDSSAQDTHLGVGSGTLGPASRLSQLTAARPWAVGWARGNPGENPQVRVHCLAPAAWPSHMVWSHQIAPLEHL